MSYDEDSIYGIQFRADMQQGMSATAQIVGKGSDSYDAQVNWAYFTYELNDNMSLKIGRQRQPFFQYSDFLDVGYAYHWISPPHEVYDLGVDLVDGINFEHFTDIGSWTSRFNVLIGGIDTDIDGSSIEVEDSISIAWSLNYDWFTIRAMYNQSVTSVDDIREAADGINQLIGGTLTPEQMNYLDIWEDDGHFAGIGISGDWGNYFAVAEYTSVGVDDGPAGKERESWYVSGGVRIEKFTISLTYATLENPNNEDTLEVLDTVVEPTLTAIAGGLGGSELGSAAAGQLLEAIPQLYRAGYETESYNLTVRYDFHPSAAFKFDYTAESADYDQGYGTVNTREPQLVRLGVDLIF
jgi:hypothetical protein